VAQPVQHRRDAVLRNREHDRDGLQLGDDHDPAGVGGVHDVAGSTWRRPARPSIGEVMRQYASCTRVLSINPWSFSTAPSYWRTSDAWVSSCCRGTASLVTSVW
jgi:hypothetical protein